MKNRLKTKINVLDISLIIILILAIAGAFVRHNKNELKLLNESSKDTVITINASDPNHAVIGNISVGDKLYVTTNGRELGEVISVVRKNGSSYELNDSNIYEENFTPSNPEAVIRIKTKYKDSKNGMLSSSGIFIAPGTELELETDLLKFTGKITNATK